MYLVFTHMPGEVIKNSSLCCCVPCLLSAIISLCPFSAAYTESEC